MKMCVGPYAGGPVVGLSFDELVGPWRLRPRVPRQVAGHAGRHQGEARTVFRKRRGMLLFIKVKPASCFGSASRAFIVS